MHPDLTTRNTNVRRFRIPRVRVDDFIDMMDIMGYIYELRYDPEKKFYGAKVIMPEYETEYLKIVNLISRFVTRGLIIQGVDDEP